MKAIILVKTAPIVGAVHIAECHLVLEITIVLDVIRARKHLEKENSVSVGGWTIHDTIVIELDIIRR